ncbi:FAD:protein FMN transferase [Methyloversatilis thermotolerans]|uniref:FAD:protein FMN transferase n=1 Tax=Methyloversatilis thermotolerans TaxID=1346290 RepID=UPI0012FA03B7|nr:FAD:protein FMN transferase [Methyloversatilis thermotolerans]
MGRMFRVALCLLCALAAGCGSREQVERQESFVFGTRVEVVVYGADRAVAREALGEVLREFDRLHRLLHAWQPSELTRINRAIADGQAVDIDAEMAAILRGAQTEAARGEQLFNPAAGALIAAWGFHADEFVPHRPDPAFRERWLAARPSMADIDIAAKPEGGARLTSRNRAVQFDLGGYAKGYALDRAAALVRARGLCCALINIGGNVMAVGAKGSKPWRIAIQHPRKPEALATVELHDGEAIGTSGDYQRYFEMDGERYCHLIDPRTAEPVRHTQSLTVLMPAAPDAGARSDADSKPLFIVGREGWHALAQRMGVAMALRVDVDGSMDMTDAMKARLIAP